ncbi:uncharacterized protein EI90DRAFT_3116127 [Cantharellus anzutake]|uniref:uncharacterized protein n=1 Tax=Cantharellus anzutake TaxID=1750568 RepID=UPI00190685CA|nr:uncharacterized protein EI90DRAFT_3116127 [Cantharellus anzutake]KAF8342189.1 hypothetical protein EI90DRAFT_3116127 [Cantharellus anzutake]
MARITLNIISLLFVALVGLIAVPQPAAAYDFRVLVKWNHSQYKTGDEFCTAWKAACRSFKPKQAGFFFLGAVCEPGDYKGKHPNTEAKVTCIFQVAETEGLAKELNLRFV